MWKYWLLILRWVIVPIIVIIGLIEPLSNPSTASAEACNSNGAPRCFSGFLYNQANFGVKATIGTTSFDWSGITGFQASFTLINGQDPDSLHHAWYQVGTARELNGPCSSISTAFAEYIDYATGDPNNGSFVQTCNQYYPNTGENHDYSAQYDGNSGYWCFNYDSNCMRSAQAFGGTFDMPPTGFTIGTQVVAYGEVSDTSVQMGGNGQANAIYLSGIQYKPQNVGGTSYINSPPAPSQAYSNVCGAPNPPAGRGCPFGSASGQSASIWFVDVWTNYTYR